jgi:hypothetical protein
MRSVRKGVLLTFVTGLLAGCGGGPIGSAFYMTPYKFEDLTCQELRERAKGAAAKLKEQRDRIDLAGKSAGGGPIGVMVYGPDYDRAAWEQKLYETEAERRNCQPDEMPK